MCRCGANAQDVQARDGHQDGRTAEAPFSGRSLDLAALELTHFYLQDLSRISSRFVEQQ